MPEFQFNLEALLRQRHAREREAQHALARVQAEVLAIRNELVEVQDQMRNLQRDVVTPGHVRFMGAMTSKFAALRRKLSSCEAARSTAHEAFAATAREHKAIQLLRDKALAEWRKQQNTVEQNALDEAAARGHSEYHSA